MWRIIVFLVCLLEYANGWCNCVRAKECSVFREELLHSHSMDELDRVIERVRNAFCGFTIFAEPLVCCPPTEAMQSIDFIDRDNDRPKAPTRDRWVWDRRPQMKDEKSIKKNLIDDYVDWKTERNCPPILFKETSNKFHKHFRGHRPPIHHPHYHHHQHHHHHHPPEDFDFDDDFHHRSRLPHDHFGDGDFESRELFPADPPKSQDKATTRTTTRQTPTNSPTVNMPNCGVTLNNRIIGGIEALPGEFPWIARIAYLNRTDGSVAYRCTGSFITELHILTAAHCVANLEASLNISHIRLVESSTNDVSVSTFEIAETMVHPNYDRPRRANDIALIKVSKPPSVNLNYGTICLPPAGFNGSTAIVAGWSNDDGPESNNTRVRYLKLDIVDNSECAESYNSFREGFVEKITILPSMLCTQGKSNGSDVCRGDSGGPLMDDGRSAISNREDRYTLIGIVAFGPSCGFANLLPGVYMRVSDYVDWIMSNIH